MVTQSAKIMMENKLIIASNGCLETYNNNNNLHKFTNSLPLHYLPQNKKWCLGMESIGLHCRFLNEAVSKNNSHPALIMFSKGYLKEKLGYDNLAYIDTNIYEEREKLSLDMFSPNHLFYLNSSKAYPLESLNNEWTEIALARYDEYKTGF